MTIAAGVDAMQQRFPLQVTDSSWENILFFMPIRG
ncbi:hypothetical protein GGR66_001062 [Xanthomonas sp. 3498]|nr:hypothetical protein [Xanthomonas sp. 3498]